MPPHLPFGDERAAIDALTFAHRAERLGDGAVRLRASHGVLTLTAAPLAPQSLLDPAPTVLGMRVAAVDPELECDVVVDASLLSVTGRDLLLPDVGIAAAWAGISPPRSGWSVVGTVAASTLAARAHSGIEDVAAALPDSPGSDLAHRVRSDVWGAPDDHLLGVARGAAFAASALGFIVGDEAATVFTCGAWSRVSLTHGHALVRRTVRTGLTPVRPTSAV